MLKLRLIIVVAVLGIVLSAGSTAARAELSGDMQSDIAALVSDAIAKEDAEGLNKAINDLCAAHPDITAEIVSAFATELANKRPMGFCKGISSPCLDMNDILDQLTRNLLATTEAESRTQQLLDSNLGETASECQSSGCAPPIVEVGTTSVEAGNMNAASPDQM
jgi:hypothetical protein